MVRFVSPIVNSCSLRAGAWRKDGETGWGPRVGSGERYPDPSKNSRAEQRGGEGGGSPGPLTVPGEREREAGETEASRGNNEATSPPTVRESCEREGSRSAPDMLLPRCPDTLEAGAGEAGLR